MSDDPRMTGTPRHEIVARLREAEDALLVACDKCEGPGMACLDEQCPAWKVRAAILLRKNSKIKKG
jgi:hypothetical protein